MLKKLVLIGLVLCAFLFVFNAKSIKANPADLWVPYNYPTIQAAINAANSGDVIHVVGGPYAPVVVNKSVSLIGEGEAIIDGNDTYDTVVNIIANNVVLKNFKIQGAMGLGFLIFINASSCIVENNYLIGEDALMGVFLFQASSCRITHNTIINVTAGTDWMPGRGILLSLSSNNYIIANNIYNSYICISLEHSNLNLVSYNNVTSSQSSSGTTQGISIYESSNNTVTNNWITNCTSSSWAIDVTSGASYNLIYHNNFINNVRQARVENITNRWYADWPTGGNFWSDHIAADKFNGQYQNQPGSDGICDTPYTISGSNIDAYPLMGPCNSFEVQFGPIPSKQEISVISNSSISDFQMNTTQKTIIFNVTGETGIGFCRVDIPNVIVSGLWQNNYRVLVNDQEPLYVRNWTSGATTYIYFQYQHSTKEVVIIPEFPQNLIPLIFMIITTLIAVKTKRRQQYKLTPSIF
jgi:nitrous oxidase accessory protein NosD